MAGFLGWFRPDKPGANVPAALACLRHHASFRTRVLVGDARAGAGVVYRESDPPEVFEDPERQLVVAILGAVLEHRSAGWHRFTASELAMRYAERGVRAVSGLDGFYQLLIWDGRAGRLHLWNDRVGTMPAQHATVAGATAFAPEAKALFRLLPLKPRMDFTGMVSFLNLGYPVGTCTLFEGVRLLAPAYRLTLDLHTGGRELERTWVQRFEPDKRLGLRAAMDLIYDAIITCCKAPLCGDTRPTWIAMTGGHDSRVLLHALCAIGRKPELAVTWGATDAEPDSDPPVARALAAQLRVPHRFYRYSAEGVASHVTTWGAISEYASDNPSYFVVSPTLLYDHEIPSADAIYIGDVVIASGGLPRTVEDAVATVLSADFGRLQPRLAGVLRTSAGAACSAAFWEEVRRVVNTSPSAQPEDVQDYLWTAVYNFRWLFSPGFYKEPMFSAWRPMLLGPAYDALSQIPARLRVYRRVYVDMVHHHLPTAFRRPRADASSLVDWPYESRHEPKLRGFLQTYTSWERLAATPLGEVLDRSAFNTLVTMFFSHLPQPMARQPRYRALIALRRRFAAVPVVAGVFGMGQRLLRGKAGLSEERGLCATRLLWRIALLASMHKVVATGAFTDERGPGSESA